MPTTEYTAGYRAMRGLSPSFVTLSAASCLSMAMSFDNRGTRFTSSALLRGMGLREFVETRVDRVQVENGLTRQISSVLDRDPTSDDLKVALNNLQAFVIGAPHQAVP
jgi:hypothetical protein